MALQKSVGLYRAAGVPGDKATPRQSIYAPVQGVVAANATVTVGNFAVLTGSTNTVTPGYDATTVGAFSGLVERDINFPNYNVTSEGTLNVTAGYAPTIAVKGDYYVVSTTAATAGQFVYANTTTGAISTAATGQTVSGSKETPWKVVNGGAIGDPILISNWS